MLKKEEKELFVFPFTLVAQNKKWTLYYETRALKHFHN